MPDQLLALPVSTARPAPPALCKALLVGERQEMSAVKNKFDASEFGRGGWVAEACDPVADYDLATSLTDPARARFVRLMVVDLSCARTPAIQDALHWLELDPLWRKASGPTKFLILRAGAPAVPAGWANWAAITVGPDEDVAAAVLHELASHHPFPGTAYQTNAESFARRDTQDREARLCHLAAHAAWCLDRWKVSEPADPTQIQSPLNKHLQALKIRVLEQSRPGTAERASVDEAARVAFATAVAWRAIHAQDPAAAAALDDLDRYVHTPSADHPDAPPTEVAVRPGILLGLFVVVFARVIADAPLAAPGAAPLVAVTAAGGRAAVVVGRPAGDLFAADPGGQPLPYQSISFGLRDFLVAEEFLCPDSPQSVTLSFKTVSQ